MSGRAAHGAYTGESVGSVRCVEEPDRNMSAAPRHPDDAALLDGKGAMGDTAADHLKTRRDRARAAARMAGMGKVLAPVTTAVPTGPQMRKVVKKLSLIHL